MGIKVALCYNMNTWGIPQNEAGGHLLIESLFILRHPIIWIKKESRFYGKNYKLYR